MTDEAAGIPIDPDQLRELLKGLPPGVIPEGFLDEEEGVEVAVKAMTGSALDIMPSLMEDMGPDAVIACLTAFMGDMALKHTVASDCECGAEAHYDQIFQTLDQAIADAREHLRPKYLETAEQAIFEKEVNGGLAELEVIPEDDLDALRRALAEEE